MGYIGQKFRLFHLSNLSLLNFRYICSCKQGHRRSSSDISLILYFYTNSVQLLGTRTVTPSACQVVELIREAGIKISFLPSRDYQSRSRSWLAPGRANIVSRPVGRHHAYLYVCRMTVVLVDLPVNLMQMETASRVVEHEDRTALAR